MRALSCSLVVALLAGCGEAGPETVRAEEPKELVSTTGAARESCAGVVEALAIDHDFAGTQREDTIVQSHARGVEDCSDFSWARGVASAGVAVTPSWGGPNIATTGWDCNHSSLEYAVYRRDGGVFRYVNGAIAFGALASDGACHYSVRNSPQQPGADETVVPGEAGELRIAVRAWSHNDPAMGHAGDACDSSSCYWPVGLSWRPE